MQDVVKEIVDSLISEAHEALPDGVFPGATRLSSKQKLAHYYVVTDQADLPLLENPNYLALYKQKLAPAPVSPFWLNAISLPEEYEKLRDEFLRLQKESATW